MECLPIGMTRVESIYWYCSAANYTLLYAFGLIYIGLLLSATVDKGGKRTYDIIMACLMGFIVGGGNYMTSLSVALFSVLFAVWIFKGRKNNLLLVPIIFNLIGFVLSCIAPGNSVRGSDVEGFGFVKTIMICIFYVLHYCIDQWTTWAVLLLLLISLPFMWKLTEKCSLSFKYPIPVLFGAYTFIAVNIAPPIYSLGNIEAGRLQGLIFMQYILVLVLAMFYMLGWIRSLIYGSESSVADKAEEDNTYLKGAWSGVLIVSTALFLLFAALNVKPTPEYFTTSCAVRDVVNGKAAYYRHQNLVRRQLLHDENNTDVVLDYYEYEPGLLFFADITTDPEDWTNNGMKRYYGKNSVVRTQRPASD